MLILQFTKLLTTMRKLLFLLLSVAIFASCDKKNDPTPNNSKPEDEYPTLIVGSWKLNNITEYYTPTGGGAEATRNATEDDGIVIWKFNNDNTLIESDPVSGTVYNTYKYALTGTSLKLTDQSTQESSTVQIQTLNKTVLKFKDSQYAGQPTTDDNQQTIGTNNYYIYLLDKL